MVSADGVETPGRPIFTAADLGRFLADLRKRKGWSQATLADELGVSRQYISEVEQGKPGLYTERLFAAMRLLGGGLRGEHW